MDFSITSNQPEKLKCDCIAVAVFNKGKLSLAAEALNEATNNAISAVIKLGDFKGNSGETTLINLHSGIAAKRILLMGFGQQPTTKTADVRKTLAATFKLAKSTKTKNLALCLDDVMVEGQDIDWLIHQSAELAASATYTFNNFKGKEKQTNISLNKITFLNTDKSKLTTAKKALKTASAIANGMDLSRTLGNLPGNECPPAYLAKEAKGLARGNKKLTVKIIEEKEMKELGMGALLSVSAGSDQPAKLIIMEYKGGKPTAKPHVLVGKGVTFDTGGISLKPGGDMDQMKFDMCGAAGVLGTMKAIIEMDMPLNVVGVVTSAENMPSGGASRPGDIVTTMSGLTVEILNTDAEGRLVLCDALTYVKKFKPASVIDIATLTGACLVALGNHASGMLGNNDKVMNNLRNAAQYTEDKVWELPLWDDYQQQIDSPFADMANIGGRNAGTITAACFLSRFTQDYPWAHLDIAGTAWVSAGANKGSTGRPVPLLCQYLLDQC